MQAAMRAIETEQAKQQTILQKAEMDNQAKVQVAQIESQTKLMLERLNVQMEEMKAALKMGHESRENEADREQETLMAVAKPALAAPPPAFTGPNEVPLEIPSEI